MVWTRRYSAAGLLRGLLVAGMLAAAPAGAAEPSKADIQWAQKVLKEQGLYKGRENGELNDPTRAALTAFQKKAGLPATGRLDQATVSKLLEGREPSATVGNLAAPKPPAASQPKAKASAAPPKPVAAPSQRVEAVGEGTENVFGAVGGGASAGEAGAPLAAPSATVERTAPDGTPITASGDSWFPSGPVPGWVRMAVAAVLGIAVAMIVAGWWLSGRRSARKRRAAGPSFATQRREPSLGRRRGPELRADPPLRAGRR